MDYSNMSKGQLESLWLASRDDLKFKFDMLMIELERIEKETKLLNREELIKRFKNSHKVEDFHIIGGSKLYLIVGLCEYYKEHKTTKDLLIMIHVRVTTRIRPDFNPYKRELVCEQHSRETPSEYRTLADRVIDGYVLTGQDADLKF